MGHIPVALDPLVALVSQVWADGDVGRRVNRREDRASAGTGAGQVKASTAARGRHRGVAFADKSL